MYWKWDKWVPKEVCELLIEECKSKELQASTIMGTHTEEETKKIRNSKNIFLPTNHWFEGILMNHVRYANQSMGLNFDITGCQNVQYTVYKENEKYDWHVDHKYYTTCNPMRKLSAVCQLNDTSEFTGGGLLLKEDEQEIGSVLTQQGDVVVFPSGVLHTALPVLTGTRIVAVLWATGPAFK